MTLLVILLLLLAVGLGIGVWWYRDQLRQEQQRQVRDFASLS